MSATEEYVKRADECLQQAGACIAESNRAIFMDVAAKWRMLAKEVEAGAVPAPPATAGQGSDGLQNAGSVQSERGVAGGE
jgi:hypothetical protein